MKVTMGDAVIEFDEADLVAFEVGYETKENAESRTGGRVLLRLKDGAVATVTGKE